MKIGNLEISKIQIIIALLLIVGIIVGVILVQRQQVLKSKASGEDIYQQINVSDSNCTASENNVYDCETNNDTVEINISKLLP